MKANRLCSIILVIAMIMTMFVFSASADGAKYTVETTKDGWIKVTNDNGVVLGYSENSGVTIIEDDGYAFKDLNKNGKLDAYEDWRLDAQTRAEDLASQMDIDTLAGFLKEEVDWAAGTGEVTDGVKTLVEEGSRMIMGMGLPAIKDRVAYVNGIEELAESSPLGNPVVFELEYGSLANLPKNMGLAASFDPEIVAMAGKITSAMYRAVGVSTTLTPQIDLVTEPRWRRFIDCFTEDPQLGIDMAVAFANAMQSTYDEDGNDLGWGSESVATILKHFPGDGPAESGRESHSFYGKYTVYPGDNFDTLLLPFEACFNLPGLTGSATGIMPSYSAAYDEDGEPLGDDVAVGSGFSYFKLTETLREDLGFEGFVSTDWGVTDDEGRPWGVEDLTMAERIKMLWEVGNDMIGYSYRTKADMLDGIAAYQEEYGEEATLERLQLSAARVLKTQFNNGEFENSYLSLDASKAVLDNKDYAAAAYDAQLKSLIMLKNSDSLIKDNGGSKPTVYIPMKASGDSYALPVDARTAAKYFNIVTDTINGTELVRATDEQLADVDYAVVFINSPANIGEGYDAEAGEYIPISLQYGDYTANSIFVRQQSLGGDQVEVVLDTTYGAQTVKTTENRSYFGKSAQISNASDLDLVLETAARVDKVAVVLNISIPTIVSEFESEVDAIVLQFSASDEAVCAVLSGSAEPTGLLPFQMPADMETVEAQYEDVPRDMDAYEDADGNTYDFAFGMNWSGVIDDERVETYNVEPLSE